MSDATNSPLAPDPPQGDEFYEQMDAPKLPKASRKRKRRLRWRAYRPIALLLGGLVLLWVLYAVIWPPLEIRRTIATAKWKYAKNDPAISIPTRMLFRTCEFLYGFWFFYLGASIGSFINVVANRTPQGKTIVSRGSHCPYCDTPLRMIDNTPIFGWVALRGRCRSCRLPIAPRYLIMELVVGAIFMILAVVELMGNGMNLPHRDWKYGAGIVSTVFYPNWILIGACIAHASLFAIAVMLIASHIDRLRFPTLPLIVIGAIAIAWASVNPIVSPVHWAEPWGPRYPISEGASWARLQTSLIGTAAGLVVSLVFTTLLWLAYFRTSPSARWWVHGVAIFTFSGALLGWQAVCQAGLLAIALSAIALGLPPSARAIARSPDPATRTQVLALAIATITLLLHHLFWRHIAFLSLLPFRYGN